MIRHLQVRVDLSLVNLGCWQHITIEDKSNTRFDFQHKKLLNEIV